MTERHWPRTRPVRYHWWTIRYDAEQHPRGWIQAVKLGPFALTRYDVDGREGFAVIFYEWTLWHYEEASQ